MIKIIHIIAPVAFLSLAMCSSTPAAADIRDEKHCHLEEAIYDSDGNEVVLGLGNSMHGQTCFKKLGEKDHGVLKPSPSQIVSIFGTAAGVLVFFMFNPF